MGIKDHGEATERPPCVVCQEHPSMYGYPYCYRCEDEWRAMKRREREESE